MNKEVVIQTRDTPTGIEIFVTMPDGVEFQVHESLKRFVSLFMQDKWTKTKGA